RAGCRPPPSLAARRWRRRSRPLPVSPSPRLPVPPPLPPVSILKPVRGLEPHAAHTFASFCAQEYPEYELLFGVADPADPAAELVRSLAGRYPKAPFRLIPTRRLF